MIATKHENINFAGIGSNVLSIYALLLMLKHLFRKTFFLSSAMQGRFFLARAGGVECDTVNNSCVC